MESSKSSEATWSARESTQEPGEIFSPDRSSFDRQVGSRSQFPSNSYERERAGRSHFPSDHGFSRHARPASPGGRFPAQSRRNFYHSPDEYYHRSEARHHYRSSSPYSSFERRKRKRSRSSSWSPSPDRRRSSPSRRRHGGGSQRERRYYHDVNYHSRSRSPSTNRWRQRRSRSRRSDSGTSEKRSAARSEIRIRAEERHRLKDRQNVPSSSQPSQPVQQAANSLQAKNKENVTPAVQPASAAGAAPSEAVYPASDSPPPTPGRDLVLAPVKQEEERAPTPPPIPLQPVPIPEVHHDVEDSDASDILDTLDEKKPSKWDPPGPPVLEKVREKVMAWFAEPIDFKRAEEIYKTLPRPENLPCLKKTKLNPEIENAAKEATKDFRPLDTDIAAILWANQFATTAIIKVLNTCYNRNQRLSKSDLLGPLGTAVKILARSANMTNDLRRKLIRPKMAGKYTSLANPSKEDFEYLLGQNLPGQMKSVSDESNLVLELLPSANKTHLNSKRGSQAKTGAPNSHKSKGKPTKRSQSFHRNRQAKNQSKPKEQQKTSKQS